jgi:hypothetical protein
MYGFLEVGFGARFPNTLPSSPESFVVFFDCFEPPEIGAKKVEIEEDILFANLFKMPKA